MTAASERANRRRSLASGAVVLATLAGWWVCGVIAMLLLSGDIDDPDSPARAAKVLGSGFAAASVVFLVGSVFIVARRLLARHRDGPTPLPT